MEDILFSYPEACGENDCQVGWHIYHVWGYDDGTYSVCDSDGDHTGIDEAEVDDLRGKLRSMWRDYAKHVAGTGTDPLAEFMVRPRLERTERWRARFNDSPLGLELVDARWEGGGWTRPEDLPSEVIQFLNAHNRHHMWFTDDFPDAAALIEMIIGDTDLKRYPSTAYSCVVGFRLKLSRPNRNYEPQLRKAARKAAKSGY